MSYSVTIPVRGMNCAGCARRLETDLNGLGTFRAQVNFATEQATIESDAPAPLAEVMSLLDSKGYRTDTAELTLSVYGWNCAGCSAKTERKLKEHPLVLDAHANLANQQIQIRYIPTGMTPARLAAMIGELGYQAEGLEADLTSRAQQLEKQEQQHRDEMRRQLLWVIAGSLLTLPLVAGMVGMVSGILSWHLPPLAEFALATPVQFGLGARFYRGSYSSLKNRYANMDVLVALGTSAAYFYSLYLWLLHGDSARGHLYFEASAVVITLISWGKFMEARSRHQVSQALRELIALRPATARVIRGESVRELPADAVLQGDLVRVLPGERIPVDGVIIRGRSELDESLITGESLPVEKCEGDAVIAGAINGNGALEIETSRIGEQTRLGQIIHQVEQAQLSRAPIQQLVDKVSAIFVPAVLVTAALTFAAWMLWAGNFESALIAAVSVLVIACPCALGLATPAALVAGTGRAARAGILIRDIETLQQAHKINALVFDKTGTLTQGKPDVVEVELMTVDEPTLIQHLASLQQHSEHLLAKAIMNYAKQREIPLLEVSDSKTVPGAGIIGRIDGRQWLAGNARLLQQQQIPLPQADEQEEAYTQIWVARDGELLGRIKLSDPLRPESYDAISRLKQRGIEPHLLSGDNRATVAAIAAELGIAQWQHSLQPEDKARQVQALQQQAGKVVAMVGDGINDAPALAQADVGIAMGSGTDVAMATAGLTLLRPDPRLVGDAIGISGTTWRTIKQNLFWAFVFNAVGIPLAAMGWLSPELAGAAMALSSVTVLTNSLQLKRRRIG